MQLVAELGDKRLAALLVDLEAEVQQFQVVLLLHLLVLVLRDKGIEVVMAITT